MKLHSTVQPEEVLMKHLKEGQIAVLLERYPGHIVQCIAGDCAITLGRKGEFSFSSISFNNLKVRILQPGELLEIE